MSVEATASQYAPLLGSPTNAAVDAILTIAPPFPRAATRGTASAAPERNPLRWLELTADRSASEIFPTRPTLKCPIIDEDVHQVGFRIDRLESLRDPGQSRDVGFEIANARRGSGGGQLVEGEDARSVGEQPFGNCVANPARGARHDSDAAPKRIGPRRPPLGAPQPLSTSTSHR